MSRLSIARSLLLALVGLTVVLSVVAGLAVSGLYEARQRYEERLAISYATEVATANLLAAGVVEETVLRREGLDATGRRRARATFDSAARAARTSARGDRRSQDLVEAIVTAETAARQAGARLRRARGANGRRAALALLADAFRQGRRAAGALSARQDARRREAREAASEDSRRATLTTAFTAGLALLGALGLVFLLVGGLRRPLDRLVVATRRLAEGDLDARVHPEGPAELQELSSAFNVMAADLDAARDRIEAARLRLAATIESLGDGLLICDGHGRVQQVNPRAGDLVPEIAPGQRLATDPGPLPPLAAVLDREIEIVHRDRTLSVTAARMGEALEDGVVFTLRDVTERARLERAKSEFVATASHELRSPLTSIKGFVELLAAGELTERQRGFIEVILLSTNRLVDLVSDLLDVARVEAGQLEIQRRPIALGEAVEEVTTLMRPRIEAKQQALEVDIAEALPAASADPGRIRQIVINLLTNAHLYTPEGGSIAVRVGATAEHVTIAIADTGRGMSDEQQTRLFERFYRADGRSAAEAGTGLGMSIVRSLVDLHGGEIDVESQSGEGTTITVCIPRAPADSEQVVLAGRARVLVVGRAGSRQEVEPLLQRHDIDYVWATSANEASRLCGEQQFELALVDAGLRSPQAALAALDLRSPHLRRSVVVFSTGQMAADPVGLAETVVPVEDATQAVADALRSLTGR